MDYSLTKIGLIAIVDDDEPLREALGSVLKAAGLSIDTLASAEEFQASPNRADIACVILDVRLPGISGIESQRQMSESGDTTPIIFMTAHGDMSIRDAVLQNRRGRIPEQAHPQRCTLETNSLGARNNKARHPSVKQIFGGQRCSQPR